jgi:hypothetical protein
LVKVEEKIKQIEKDRETQPFFDALSYVSKEEISETTEDTTL